MNIAEPEIYRAVPDAYAFYSIALGHTPGAAVIRERTTCGRLTLVITALAVISASGMATCGERSCGRDHPADVTRLLGNLMVAEGAELSSLTPRQATEVGALYRDQVSARYMGDAVIAACAAALVARTENIPLLTTPRSRYCYVADPIDSLAARIEIE
jgi:hypothetical protein